jgi:hypothetical protein
MGKPTIIVVSHKRAGKVLTHHAVNDCLICIPQSQLEEYAKYHEPETLLVHPDEVVGLFSKRQWILEQFPDVFMLDDDIKEMRAVHAQIGEQARIPPEVATEIIYATAMASQQAGCFVYGFNQSAIPTAYNGLQPIQMTGYLIQGWIGFNAGHKLFYPRDKPHRFCGDYWIAGLNAHYHRKIWKDNRFSFVAVDTFVGAGGQAEFRSMDKEEEDFNFLREHFGEVIQFKRDTGLAKRKHKFQKSLKLPY